MTEPTAADLASPAFQAIWETIKKWDLSRGVEDQRHLNIPGDRHLFSGATGTDVMAILEPLRERGLLIENLVEKIGGLDSQSLDERYVTIEEVVKNACEKSGTMVDALSFAATVENEHAIKRAVEALRTGHIEPDGHRWHTFFRYIFTRVLEEWHRTHLVDEIGKLDT